MMIYLLKFILCSGVLYTFYHFVLRNDKLFRFNRVFLLSIVVLSALIPFITVKTNIVKVPAEQNIALISSTIGDGTRAEMNPLMAPPAQALNVIQFSLVAYMAITGLLLIKLTMNLWSLSRFKKGGKVVNHNGLSIVLRSDITHSFSFLNHMYTNKESYEQGELPGEILAHEQAHIHQKHSYDILFLELVSCLCWFNPIIFLIKRAIQLNHEFLADEAVISETGALVQYQNIIINFASQQMVLNPKLASHLTFGETKKRITIMVKTKDTPLNFIRQAVTFALIIVLFAFLGKTKIIAQQVPLSTTVASTSLPKMIVKKFQDKQDTKQKKTNASLRFPQVSLTPNSRVKYTDTNGEQVEAVFKELSPQMQDNFKSGKINGSVLVAAPEKLSISSELLEEFKDSSKYRIRIDGNPNRNGVLNKFSSDDFHHFFKNLVSEEGEKEIYRISLITNKLHGSIDRDNIKITKMKFWMPYPSAAKTEN